MQHSLYSLNTTKNYKNLSNIFSSVIFKKIVTFVGVLVVDIHWGGLLVSDLKTLTISAFYFTRGQSDSTKNRSRYQLPNGGSRADRSFENFFRF